MSRWDSLAEEVLAAALVNTPQRLGDWPEVLAQLNARIEEGRLPNGIVGTTRIDRMGPAEITIDSRPSQGRRTFTAAHELGHLMLMRSTVVSLLGDDLPPAGAETEALCDAIAAALLIPGSWVDTLPDTPPRLAQLLPIANHYGISPSVFANRLASLERHCLLLSAQWSRGGWGWKFHSGRVPGVALRRLDANALIQEFAGNTALTDAEWRAGSKAAAPFASAGCGCSSSTSPPYLVDVIKRKPTCALVWIRPPSWSPQPRCERLTS